MRASFICHEFPPTGGGASTALDAMTRTLARRGHAVQILTVGLGNGTTIDHNGPSREVLRFGVGRKRLLSPSAWELLRSYVALRYTSAGFLRKFLPDLIVGYFAFPAGRAALSLGRRMNLPVVVSLRGSDVPGFSDTRWGALRFVQGALVRPVLEQADLLLANGRFLTGLAEAVAPRREIINLPNGVDTQLYHPPARPREAGPLKVLFVGQLIERKRCLDVIEGVRWLGQQGADAELTIVGEGPLRPTVESMIRRVPERIHIVLAGPVPREAMPEIYRGHDVLVHLSKAEGVSNVLLEALASGLCVVGTPSAAAEVLNREEAGILLDAVTPQRVGGALRFLIEMPERRHEMQLAARRIAERYSWDATAESFERCISGLLAEDARH